MRFQLFMGNCCIKRGKSKVLMEETLDIAFDFRCSNNSLEFCFHHNHHMAENTSFTFCKKDMVSVVIMTNYGNASNNYMQPDLIIHPVINDLSWANRKVYLYNESWKPLELSMHSNAIAIM